MTLTRLVIRSLSFYRRTHTAIFLGTVISTVVLTGSLMVGDSVRATLRHLALLRVGRAHFLLHTEDRFFRSELAAAISDKTGRPSAALLFLEGSISTPDGSARINRIQVAGCGQDFWSLAPTPQRAAPLPGTTWISEVLARRLGAKIGDIVIIKVEKPALFSRDAPLSGSRDTTIALRLTIERLLDDEAFARFGLYPSQTSPLNAFVALEEFQQRLALEDGANLLLSGISESAASEVSHEAMDSALQASWQLKDAGLQLNELTHSSQWEIRSNRVFLDPSVAEAVLASGSESGFRGNGLLTYFATSIQSGELATPYSMVTAANPAETHFLPDDLRRHEVIINSWLADDLDASVGDELTIRYFVVGERRNLREESANFTVRGILPMSGDSAEAHWMPDFPGLVDAENCRDWDPGIPIQLNRIRDRDEAYWDLYRGAPKAFIHLERGRQLWSNRWGNLTAIRFDNAFSPQTFSEQLRNRLDLRHIGLRFSPFRSDALASTQSPVDFSGLFVGFSFFLIMAALILTGMLYTFSAEQRNEEAGTLLSFGFSPAWIRRRFLLEAGILTMLGSTVGVGLAVAYTQVILSALATVWQGAVGNVSFLVSLQGNTATIGFLAGIATAMGAIWWSGRRLFSASPQMLMASGRFFELETQASLSRLPQRVRRSFILAVIALVASILLIVAVPTDSGSQAAGVYFASGTLLLFAALGLLQARLMAQALPPHRKLSLPGLGLRNAARSRGRSMAIAIVLASGVFIVVSTNAFRHQTGEENLSRQSGTGGFAFIGESTMPIYDDINTAGGRLELGLAKSFPEGVAFVPMRVRQGDEASCLNLNRALQPRLLGVRPDELLDRKAFLFAPDQAGENSASGWATLNTNADDLPDTIPAVADEATVRWALGLSAGDTLTYLDEQGKPFKVRIDGILQGSILQGNIMIAEEQFVEKFPSLDGYRYFLIDAPAENLEATRQSLTRLFLDQGMNLIPTAERLAEFRRVENTYLSIFQVLGGFGLLLGTAGLGVVVARNITERRGEFGLMRSIGFLPKILNRLIYYENRTLILWGLVTGVGAATAAVWPSLSGQGISVAIRGMVLLVLALLVLCLVWLRFAIAIALRSGSTQALRDE